MSRPKLTPDSSSPTMASTTFFPSFMAMASATFFAIQTKPTPIFVSAIHTDLPKSLSFQASHQSQAHLLVSNTENIIKITRNINIIGLITILVLNLWHLCQNVPQAFNCVKLILNLSSLCQNGPYH